MTGPDSMGNDFQRDPFETEATRSLPDRLPTDSRLCIKSKAARYGATGRQLSRLCA
jgi:hypothetical protein